MPMYKMMIVLSFCANTVLAQKNITSQNIYWLRYYNQLSIGKSLVWHNEIEDRRFFEGNTQHHLIVHSHLHYKFYPNMDAALGLTYSLQSPHDPSAITRLTVPEIRPFQELSLTNPVNKRLSLLHRFRLDERFIHKNNGTTLLDGSDFNFRFRYRFQINYTLTKPEAKNPIITKLSDELMVNAGSNIVYNYFDQNRVYFGAEFGLSKHLAAELGYVWWFQQRSAGNQYFDRNIVRLTVLHRIKL